MRYKVGDKVRVKEDLDKNKTYGLYMYTNEMSKYAGKETIIKNFWCGIYSLEIDNGNNGWSEEMLEPITEKEQFTKKDLKFGDIVTLRNGEKGLFSKKQITLENGEFIFTSSYNNNLINKNNFYGLDIMKVQRYIHYSQYGDTIYTLTTLYEKKEEILTEKEKEYLAGVIKPFRDKVKYINKVKFNDELGVCISIDLEGGGDIELPYFKKDTYKGMKWGEPYKLEELGL